MANDLDLVEATDPDLPKWELAHQLQRVWRYLKWGVTAVLALLFLLIIGQGFLFYGFFADIHPVLGFVFVALFAALLFLLIGRPLKAYLSTPVVAEPPKTVRDPDAPTYAAIEARLIYDLKFLRSFLRHPDLKEQAASISSSLKEGQALLANAKSRPASEGALFEQLIAFETNHIEPILAPLDAKVDALIHSESVAIGVATAASMNGTVDAFIVLWRSANLIAKISRIYFGRPNFRGSLLILRDVAAIVVMSRALDDVTDITGDIIGSTLGRMGGLVAGPVIDGAINAMMALKLGYLTKRRCRSFEGWKPAQARSISAKALARVKKESTAVVGELIAACGGLTASAAKATESVMKGSRNAWSTVQSWFGNTANRTGRES